MAQRDVSRTPRGAGSGASNEEIAALVFQREQARHAKDFSDADRLREELKAVGVTCWDKKNQWECSDGRRGSIPTFAEVEAGVMKEEIQDASPDSYPGGESEVWIRQMVAAREAARADKNYGESDRIREELNAQGVKVFDKEKMWKQESTGLQGCVLGYSQNGSKPTDLEIRTLVVEREKAREGKDYAKSDIIRDDLRRHGVEIRDKEKLWKTSDGRSGPVPSFQDILQGQGVAVAGGQAIVGGGGQIDLNQQIVAAATLGAQNPTTAQQTLQLLAQIAQLLPGGQPQQQPIVGMQQPALGRQQPMMGMQQQLPLPRAQPLPRVHAKPQGISAATTTNPTAQQAIQFANNCKNSGHFVSDESIQWLVDTRERVRAQKDFPASDAIRDTLRGVLNVNLFEKEKRWQAGDGRQGRIPTFQELGIVA